MYFLLRSNEDIDPDIADSAGIGDATEEIQNNEVITASNDTSNDISVTDVTNMSQQVAVQLLENQGFTVNVEEAQSNEVPAGHVISQTPNAGILQSPEIPVTIVISTGPQVTVITLTNRGSPITELFLRINEEESVGVAFEPTGSTAEVDWINSDPSIFRVIPDSTGTGARIIAESPGSAVLTIRAGTLTHMCTVIITTMEPQHGTLLRYMYDNMERRSANIYLHVSWTSGRYAGDTTELVRDSNSDIWFMYGVNDNNREVFPTFDYDGTAYLMKFERVGQTTYYFLENGTGYFLDTNGENRQDFTWEFWAY